MLIFLHIGDFMRFFTKLEKKFGKFAVPHLMLYITVAYAIGYIMYWAGGIQILSLLSLNAEKILQGQVWRIVTFIIQPPTSSSPIFFLITLYFYYMIGSYLEREWGKFSFNLYFFSGMALHVIAAIVIYLIFGVVMQMSVYYLNLALFMAFAFEQPDTMLRLFFIIPFKIRWMAIIDAIYLGATIVLGYMAIFIPFSYNFHMVMAQFGIRLSPTNATAALIAMLNFILYMVFMRPKKRVNDYYKRTNAYSGNYTGAYNYGSSARKSAPEGSDQGKYGQDDVVQFKIRPRHKCAICGKTDLDDENEIFRFCSKCDGAYEYCSEHLKNHNHVYRDVNDGTLKRD